MPIQIRVMSWNIQKKQTNAPFIAELMRVHQIDVCALLEVPNSASDTIPQQIIVELDNLAVAYHQHNWHYTSVDVGDEAVTFLWHQAAGVGANAFVGATCANDATKYLAGKVMKNAGNNTIYFPKTQTSWASLPGSPNGRRPAFMTFLTNDGAAARRFTVLDLHAPFDVAHSIQSYAAHLYASAREIQSVETVNALAAIDTAATALAGTVPMTFRLLVQGITNYATFADPTALWTGAIAGAFDVITKIADKTGIDLTTVLPFAARAGVDGAIREVGPIPRTLAAADARSLAQACALAGAEAAVGLVAAIGLPTAPAAATASAAAARGAAETAVTAVVMAYVHPGHPTGAAIKKKVVVEARSIANQALTGFTFAAVPQVAVGASVIAADFNVDYPDPIVYTAAQQHILGGNDAYAALAAAAGAAARNQAPSTRTGPTAFDKQRVFTLRNPCPIQHTNNAAANYVPLDVTSLVATPASLLGFDALVAHLQTLPRVAGASWAYLWSNFRGALLAAFDNTAINDTAFYRTSAYDNMFVRAAAAVGGVQLIDVMSELGSWLQPAALVNPHPAMGAGALAVNPWPAAARSLNAIARGRLGALPNPIQYSYGRGAAAVTYTLTVPLPNAREVAVFYDQFISDHLPVFVEVQI